MIFYTNFTVLGPTRARVLEVLRSAARDAYVASIDDASVVCDRMADEFDTGEVEALARTLSTTLHTPVLTAINHGDHVLLLVLHAGSELIFQYTSDRSYFSGGEPGPQGDDPALLAQAFRRTDRTDEVRRVLGLEDDAGADAPAYATASERHAALCDALVLPRTAVGLSYDAVAERAVPEHAAGAPFQKA